MAVNGAPAGIRPGIARMISATHDFGQPGGDLHSLLVDLAGDGVPLSALDQAALTTCATLLESAVNVIRSTVKIARAR